MGCTHVSAGAVLILDPSGNLRCTPQAPMACRMGSPPCVGGSEQAMHALTCACMAIRVSPCSSSEPDAGVTWRSGEDSFFCIT